MSDFDHRIVGPNHNRLLEIGARHSADGSLVSGTVTLMDANRLVAAGWQVYSGPARAVDGWVVPDSDPVLKARNTLAH